MTRNEQAVKIASGIAQMNSVAINEAQRFFLTSDITQLMHKVIQRGAQ